jgi:hypothetical protein
LPTSFLPGGFEIMNICITDSNRRQLAEKARTRSPSKTSGILIDLLISCVDFIIVLVVAFHFVFLL